MVAHIATGIYYDDFWALKSSINRQRLTLFCLWMSAPCSRSSSATSLCPLWLARWSGESPSYSRDINVYRNWSGAPMTWTIAHSQFHSIGLTLHNATPLHEFAPHNAWGRKTHLILIHWKTVWAGIGNIVLRFEAGHLLLITTWLPTPRHPSPLHSLTSSPPYTLTSPHPHPLTHTYTYMYMYLSFSGGVRRGRCCCLRGSRGGGTGGPGRWAGWCPYEPQTSAHSSADLFGPSPWTSWSLYIVGSRGMYMYACTGYTCIYMYELLSL